MDYRSLTSLMLRLAGVFIVVSAVTSAPHTFFGLLYRRGAESVDIWLLPHSLHSPSPFWSACS
jgi:hypothetical protein